eukprot:528094-Pelagomonas_calceolata.AAC.1
MARLRGQFVDLQASCECLEGQGHWKGDSGRRGKVRGVQRKFYMSLPGKDFHPPARRNVWCPPTTIIFWLILVANNGWHGEKETRERACPALQRCASIMIEQEYIQSFGKGGQGSSEKFPVTLPKGQDRTSNLACAVQSAWKSLRMGLPRFHGRMQVQQGRTRERGRRRENQRKSIESQAEGAHTGSARFRNS